MFNLYVVQARYGDCLLLEFGTRDLPSYILVDGGPNSVYEDHLHPILKEIKQHGGSLDVVVVSHVDDDHIVGILDLVTEILYQRDNGLPGTITISELWHNTFSQTLGSDIENRFTTFLARAGNVRQSMRVADRTNRDIAKGDDLTHAVDDLDIPINSRFDPSGIVSLGITNDPIIMKNLTLWIVGPNKTNLANLRQEWLDWLEEQEERVLVRDMGEAERAAGRADTRVPNLSSIMFLAEADGKSVLMTGDGRSDHLLDGLRQAKLLKAEGTLHVNVLKLPHHGSRHNTSKEFLQVVTADQYVVSASGRYRHPSRQTLQWIAEVAKEQGRDVEIVLTNYTSAVDQLLQIYDPVEYGYSLSEMPMGEHFKVLKLVA